MYQRIVLTSLALASLTVGLTGCNGGGDTTTTGGTTTSKSAIGVVGGQPGALTFAGSNAIIGGTVTEGDNPATSNDVQPGDVIVATVDTLATKASGTVRLSSVDIRFELKGALSRIDTTSGTVELLSQVVYTDALTRVYEENADDSYTSLTLADLVVNDYADISGTRRSDGSILATRIERKLLKSGDADYAKVEMRGTISNLNSTSKTFSLGMQLVDYSNATLKGTLANGIRVEVKGSMNGNTLAARKVSTESKRDVDKGNAGELQGPATTLDTVNKTFNLLGYRVDYSNARVTGTLTEGARVEAEGSFDSADAAVFRAREVEVKHSRGGMGTANSEVKGSVSNLNATLRQFDVGTLGFYADDNTLVERDDTAATFSTLQNGDFVEVKHDTTRTVANRSYAVKIELKHD